MRFTELQPLMHAVLDGEASSAETAELERQLAASPAARAEFEQLRRLFDDLASVPRRHPPEGLVAAVQAALPGVPRPAGRVVQLSPASRVLAAAAGSIHVAADSPLEQELQPSPPQRSRPMTQPHPPFSARRKAMIGGGIAVVAALIVWQFGSDSTIRSEDVAGTVVPAQRYRAPQAATDIKLGDQSLAQLMQDDAFVRLIRDPQVQALVREPGFAEAAKLMRDHPEVARLMLVHAESGKRVLAAPELAMAMQTNAEAALAVERTAAAALALEASPQARMLLSGNAELAQYVAFMAQLERTSAFKRVDLAALDQQAQQVAVEKKAQKIAADRVLALNLEQAQLVAERAARAERAVNWQAVEKLAAQNTAVERFVLANQDLARFAAQYVDAARVLNASAAAAQLVTMDAKAAQLMMFNAELARVVANSPAAMQAVLAYPDAALALLAAPAASRYILMNTDAARAAVERAVAERATVDRATAERAAAERAAADRAYK